MKATLYKIRSVKACLNEAFQAIRNHFWNICKTVWLPLLVLCAVCTLNSWLHMPNKELHDWGEANPVTSFVVQTAVFVLLVLAGCWFGGAVYQWLNKNGLLRNCWKFAKVNLICYGFFALVLYALIYGVDLVFKLPANLLGMGLTFLVLMVKMLLVLLIMAALCPPTAYLYVKYMIDDQARLRHSAQYLRTGFRHWGSLFVTLLLTGFIGCAVITITIAPAIILEVASTKAQLGALQGDDLSLPGYFSPMLIIVLFLSHAIIFTFSIWGDMFLWYACGSIEEKEKERKALNIKTINAEIDETNTIY